MEWSRPLASPLRIFWVQVRGTSKWLQRTAITWQRGRLQDIWLVRKGRQVFHNTDQAFNRLAVNKSLQTHFFANLKESPTEKFVRVIFAGRNFRVWLVGFSTGPLKCLKHVWAFIYLEALNCVNSSFRFLNLEPIISNFLLNCVTMLMWNKHGLVRFSRPTECSSTSKILHRESDNIVTNESALIPSQTLLPQSQDIKADKPLPVLYLFIYFIYFFASDECTMKITKVHKTIFATILDYICAIYCPTS